jgi:hypothetical protein
MIGRVSELWNKEVPRPLLYPAVNRRIEINEVPAAYQPRSWYETVAYHRLARNRDVIAPVPRRV